MTTTGALGELDSTAYAPCGFPPPAGGTACLPPAKRNAGDINGHFCNPPRALCRDSIDREGAEQEELDPEDWAGEGGSGGAAEYYE